MHWKNKTQIAGILIFSRTIQLTMTAELLPGFQNDDIDDAGCEIEKHVSLRNASSETWFARGLSALIVTRRPCLEN